MASSWRLRGLGAVVLLMVVVAACVEPPVEHGDRAVHYDSIGELVASADAVAIGRVAATSRGRVLDQEDVVFTIMDVRVVVEQLWAGRIPTHVFTIEQPGWETTARRPGWRGWFDAAGEVVPLAVELRRRSMVDQAASSLVGVTAAMVWSRAARRAGRYRWPLTRRNCLRASPMPAAVQRSTIWPSCQRLTLTA